MGRLSAKNMGGMNWAIRVSLILAFAVIFGALFCGPFTGLNTVEAACNANTPTVTITPASNTISSIGGSVTYNVTVKNNDTGSGCPTVTYTLTASDSNTTNFNASTLSSTSVALAQGATSGVITLTVAGKAGQTSGTDTTTVTADGGAGRIGTNNVTTTICITAAPTVAITPASQQITTIGGNVTYNVTVTNNDSSTCTNTTYTLAPSDSNTTNFNASTLSSTSVALAPGATSSTITLTVTGKAGQTSGTDTTTVTASATGHTNGTNNVTTTLCIYAAPTLTITPASSTIFSVGGIVTYNVTITNNDPVCAPTTTFTLAPSDSNTTNFNASTLSSTSVALAPGATSSTITLTVTGKAGQTSGTDTTTVTASATGHTNGTNNVTTNICIYAAPTVTISAPTSQNVGPGLSVNYTVSVTNNDSPTCPATTFNLSKTDTPSLPNTSFSASTLPATIGPISGGSTATVTLTHTATSGALRDATEQSTVSTAADANHAAATTPSPAVSTVESVITNAQAWTNVYNGTSPGSVSYTVNAGTNRLLVVAVASSFAGTAATTTTTVTFGGQSLTKVVSDDTTSSREHTALFYLKDATIPSGAQTLTVTVSGTPTKVAAYTAVFTGVDQTNPIDASQNVNSSTDANSIAFSTALTVNAYDQAVYVSNIFNNASTTIPTYTISANWTGQANATGSDAFNSAGWKSEVANRVVPASNTTDTANITSINPVSRSAISGMSLKPTPICEYVAPTVTITPSSQLIPSVGGSVTYNVTITNNDIALCAATTFTLAASDSNTTNFNASTLSSTSVTVAGAATSSAITLTVTGKAGQTSGTDTTTVTASATGHTNGTNNVSTILDSSARATIVYSNNTTTPQYRKYSPSADIFANEAGTLANAAQTFVVTKAAPSRDEKIAGYVTTGGVLYIMRWNGSSWSNEWNVTVGGAGINGRRFDIAYEKTSGNAVVVYSNNTNSTFVYRSWNGTTWTAASTFTSGRLTGVPNMIKLRSRPTAGSNELALTAASANNILTTLRWNGTDWTTLPEITNAHTTNLMRSTNNGDCDSFDVQYEGTTGDLLVVFSDNAPQQYHQELRAGTWQTATSWATARSAPLQMAAASDPDSNNIVVVWNRGANATVSARIWDGTANTMGTIATVGTNGQTTAINQKTVAAGWVSSGGTTAAVVVWGSTAATQIDYAYTTNAGSSWTTSQTWVPTGTLGTASKRWMHIDSDPVKDAFMLTFSEVNTQNKLWAKRLQFTGPSTFTWSDSDGGTPLTTALASVTSQNFSFAYDRFICIAAAPTVTITPASQVISTVGGSVTYNVTITNNDWAACSSTTFTLAPSDSNTTNFNTSTLSSTSVTLAPGATSSTITLTVTGAVGQNSGTDTTTVTASATGHTNGTNNVSTSICIAVAPTVTIAPASQIISTVGGSVTYNVTVKNNDPASCPSITFTLAPSDSNTTNFNTSTLSSTSVTLAPGATSSTITLTVSGKAGQTSGTDTTTVTASATGHTNGTNNVTTTICITAAPTVTITPASQTISTVGGSVTYNVTVKNNDSATCTSTTFTLTPSDSNTTNFNASTLSSTSVTLAGGATSSTITLTVTGAVGQNSGTDTTTVTASATGHTNGTNNVTTTLCVYAAPTVTISTPTSKNVNAGGPVSYTVSVTNNDSSTCAATTFTLSKTDTPTVPNTNFSASTLPATIGPINGGSTATVTLTHTAAAGAIGGKTEQTTVSTAADANHAAATTPTPAISTIASVVNNQQGWTKVIDQSGGTASTSYTVSSGTNRLMVVAVTSAVSSSATQTATVTFGGTSLTQQVTDGGTSAREHTWLFYLKDTPAVMNGAPQTLSVTISGGTMVNNAVYVAVFSGVDQTTPITNSKNYNNDTGVTSAAFATPLTVGAGDQAVYVSRIYNTTNFTIPTYTMSANWTSGANATGTSGFTAWKTEVANRAIPTSDTTDAANITSITPSSRVSLSGMTLNAAAVCTRNNPTVAVNLPTSRNVAKGATANYTISVTNNDSTVCATTTFTLSKTDTPSVPNADYSASSLASSSTGAMNPGATWTTTLTHTATAGASSGATEDTSVTTAADSYHDAVTTPVPAETEIDVPSATVVYSNSTTTPRYRGYLATSSSFTAEAATVVGAGQTFMVDRACTTRKEHIAGYVTTGGVLYILRWDGTQWTNEWNVTIPSYDGVTGRRFDIAYSSGSGNAMVVYSNNVAGQFVYRKWDGTTWSAATTVTMSRLTGAIVSLRLASKSVTAGSGMAIAGLGSNGNLSAMIYSTSADSWGNEPSQALSTNVYYSTSRGDVPAFDLAFENTTGDLLVVNTTSGSNNINYWTYSGAAWTGPSTYTTSTANGAIFAAPDPNPASNQILVAATKTVGGFPPYTIYAGIWSGTAFSAINSATTMGSALSVNRMPLRGGFVNQGGTTAAVIVYNGGAANQLGYSYTTNGGTSWTTGQTASVTIGNGTKYWIDADVYLHSLDTMMVTLSDGASDLWAKELVFTSPSTFTWTNADGGTALQTSLASLTTQNFSFAYDKYFPLTVLDNGLPGTGGDVCPGAISQKIDGFSLNTTSRTDGVTGLTVTTTNQAAIASMEIWNEAGTTKYFGTVNNPGSDTWVFSGGTSIPVTTSVTNYKVVVTMKGHGTAPAGSTAATAFVSAYTSSNGQTGIDTDETTLTLVNDPAGAATWETTSGGLGTAALSWIMSSGSDNVMIARFTTNTDTTMPTDGTQYTPGDPFGGGTVVFAGTGYTYTDTVLTGGTFYYRIFEYDGCLNYAATAPWTSAIVINAAYPTVPGTATASPAGTTSILVSMPYSGDANNDNTLSVDYRQTGSGSWTPWSSVTHPASPYSPTITGLTSGQSYDVQCTYTDPDGGSSTQVISPIVLPQNATTVGTATAMPNSSTTIQVRVPYTDDYNGNNTYTVDYKLSSSGTWTNWVTNAGHTASPYQTTITGLSAAESYDVRVTWNDSDGVNGTNPQVIAGVVTPLTWTNTGLLHNSINLNSSKWSAAGGWGISGAKYGAMDCITCHDPQTSNISRITGAMSVPDTSKGNIPGGSGSPVTFLSKSGFGDDSTNHATSTKICEVCHSQTTYHKYNQTAINHELPGGNRDCTYCHNHYKGFKALGCTDCHSKQQGTRVAVVGQFGGNSHHVQGVTLTNQHCYQCHWEANSDGTINTAYHGGWNSPGSSVNLVIYGNGSRPTTYTLGTTAVAYTADGSRTELQKINQVCLGCHSSQNNGIQPFGDGKTPKQYAWDGMSINDRYSQLGTTPWGKYSGANVTPKNTQTKALSAHGNAAANQRGWNLTETWPNTSGTVNVLCFDCHNSHGSTVSGTTTSYTSATTNGGILKDTTAGLGGYAMSYKPVAGGAAGTNNPYNAGAAICFDCHLTQNSGTTPWGYQGTFGATQVIMGYWDGKYFTSGGQPAGPQQRYAYKWANGTKTNRGGHFKASSNLNAPPDGSHQIGGLCTPCHDPHGVSPTLGTNQAYGVPLLKGTWMTSPYKEDSAPLAKNQSRGGGDKVSTWNGGSTPNYHIDQNTFSTGTLTRQLSGNAQSWSLTNTTRVTEDVTKFAGLCLNCHPKSSIAPGTPGTWKSMDRIHNSVKGWGTYGANNNNAIHSYTCSKCHTPHNSCQDRLLVTNCLDFKHRGQVVSGGSPGNHSGRGDKGQGAGQFPGGGGGMGDKSNYPGPWFFGKTSSPYTTACHDNANTIDPSWPEKEFWNTKSPW